MKELVNGYHSGRWMEKKRIASTAFLKRNTIATATLDT